MSDHSKYTSGFNANNSCVDNVADTADVDDANGSTSLSNYKLGLECIKNIAKKVRSFGRRAEEDEQLELFHITPDDVANVSEASNTNRDEFTAPEDNIDDPFEDCTNDDGLSNEDHKSNTTYLSPPPEVTTPVPLAVEASSNYLPVNGNATPGDRGDDDLIECKLDNANRQNVNVDSISDNNLFYTSRDSHRSRIGSNPQEQTSNVVNGPHVVPEADLREVEAEVNRRADGRTRPQVECCLQDGERLTDNEGIKTSSLQNGSSMMDEFDDEVRSDGQLYKMVAVFNDDGCLDRFVLKDLNMKDEKIGCSKWLSRTLNRDDSSLNITDVGLLNKVDGNNYNSVLDNYNNSDDLKSTNNDSKLISEVQLGQFTSRIEELTHKFHNVIKSNIEEGFEKYLHDNVFKNFHETFNKLYETSTNLEVRLEEKVANFEKRFDDLNEKLEDNFDGLEDKFRKLEQVSLKLSGKFEDKFNGFQGKFNKFDDNFNGLEDKFRKLEQVSLKLSGNFEDKFNGFQGKFNKFDDNFNGLEDKFRKLEQVSLKLSGKFEDNFKGFDDKFKNFEEVSLKLSGKFEDKVEGFEKRLDGLHEKLEDKFNGLEDKFKKLEGVSSTVLNKFIEMNDMSCKFTDNYESITNKLNDLKEDVNNSYDTLDEFIKTLDDKLKCLDTKVDISINDMNNKISLIINDFINKLDELNDIDLLVTSINGISNNINDIKLNLTNMNNNTDDLSFKLNEINLTTNKLNDRLNIINEKGYTLTNTQLIHDKLNELENRLNTTLDKFNELNNQTNDINNIINSIQNNLNQIHNKNTPFEVQSNSPSTAVEASSNSLPVNGNATPGDRGDVQPLRTGNLPGGTKDVNPEERNLVSDLTSIEIPVSDLRELEGEVNRRGATPSGIESRNVTSGGTPSGTVEGNIWTSGGTPGKEVDGRFYGINDGFHSGYMGTPGGCRIIGSACSPMVCYDESYVNTPNMDVSWVSINGRMVKHTKERISLPELAFNNSTPKNIVDINRLSQYSMTPIQITPYQSPHNYTPNNNIYNY